MDQLPPEREDDNVEYKRHLLEMNEKRFQRLASQLKHRISNGCGECIYEIGVEDDGLISGITREQTDISIQNLTELAEYCKCKICSIHTTLTKTVQDYRSVNIDQEKLFYTRVLIRDLELKYPIDIPTVILGHVNSAKSTLLGCLLTGDLDDGRGRARRFVTNHKHEFETGQTSSVGFHLTGFDDDGKIITCSETRRNRSWKKITQESKKIISFIDLCGHNKYFKTTISGVTGIKPDYAIMLIESTRGIQGLPRHLGVKSVKESESEKNERLKLHQSRRGVKNKTNGMTIEHMSLCRDQNIPFFILVTKMDLGLQRPDVLKNNIKTMRKVIKKGLGKNWIEINSEEDVYNAIKSFETTPSGNYSTIPYIQISCKTGHNMDLLRKFLNLLPKRQNYESVLNNPAKASIIERFMVEGIGTVAHCMIQEGTFKNSDKVWIGPNSTGEYKESVIKSIEYKRNKMNYIPAGRLGTLCLRNIDNTYIKKGMVILGYKPETETISKFKANIYVKEHSTTIGIGYECPLHIDNIRQTVKIIDILNQNKQILAKEEGIVIFEFIYNPVCIKKGTKFVFRESNTKGVGTVTELIH